MKPSIAWRSIIQVVLTTMLSIAVLAAADVLSLYPQTVAGVV
jgi:hypothetical protein